MFLQIFIGLSMTLLTTWLGAAIVATGDSVFTRSAHWAVASRRPARIAVALCLVLSWFVLALTVVALAWSLAFYSLGAFDSMELSLYFALVTFTTLGFGDVLLPNEWRLLAGFLAAEGLVLFGLCAALILDLLRKLETPAQ